MLFFKLLTISTAFFYSSFAHHGPHPRASKADMIRRGKLSHHCSNHVAHFNEKRWKQSLAKRADFTNPSLMEAPYYDTIQNGTCVLSPEITSGPYVWPRSQTLRQEMSEDQPGIPLWLDIGVMDMATCAPLEGALVDIWHCNATGKYSSFTEIKSIGDYQKEHNVSHVEFGVDDIHTDDTTFCRGMWPTDQNGMMEVKTIFPGFYPKRAVHIHVQIHTDWSARENGTMAHGNTVHTGEMYFDENLLQTVLAEQPYVSNTRVDRTLSSEDSIVAGNFEGGYSPMVSVVPADGEDVTKGMIGYITLGVDTEAVKFKT
ncbi:protocatechuate 3,4-dioxygenase beta subunit [Aspergillus steynii IBT 23096]|uniref:Protocatechuate 3,4-dioxygenase beta subunit n=1 Tax=Aspergillus steynii IBT 23096 TaxID=1392250 RepID=A0A2I2GI00_9EURO|nr:protocatechuate 3,4-dioxygenase beta subunit [Aspergillus steynii IBT 23096]PLB52508.1 protocatechuate 3,4-dioxygenase beta subunit [Aspergillus steynii IBT 23096]